MKSHSVTLWKYTARTLGSIVVLCGSFAITLFSTILSPNREVFAATDCANATIPQPQCEALVDIYNNMGGTSRNPVYTQGTGNTNLGGPSSGWLANNDPCSWHGVTCDTSSPKNVIGLNFGGGKYNSCRSDGLNQAGLAGLFSGTFSNLNRLQTFDIGYNTGVNHTSLRSLTMPSSLLNYCANSAGLTSLSPTQFAGLINLQQLYLNNNQITALSTTQFQGLSNLQRLFLYNNQLTGLNATQFQGLSGLNYLSLYNNQITSLSPTQFQGLSGLQGLYLNNNQLTSLSPTQFQGLSGLNYLSLSNNQLTGFSTTQFQGLSGLQGLYLHYNQITSLSPTQFQGLSGLQFLYLNNNTGFTGAIPATYSGLNFTTNLGNSRHLFVRAFGGSNPNTICGQQPTWITNAWNQYFSGNRGNTDLDDLSRFGGTEQTVNLCPSGASCNTTADCASGICSENGNPSGIFTCQGTGTNQYPTVSLTSPNNGATFTGPATISLSANATDSDGTIASVQFKSGSTVLGTDTTSPYSFSRTNVPVGTYSITAVATDNSGATATSNAVSVTVLTAGTTTYTLTGTLGITGANASVNICGSTVTANGSGAFSQSMITSGTNCSGITATKTGYTCLITTQGPNPLTGNVSNVVGTCTPTTGNLPPTISLTSPNNGATYTGPANITLNAGASDDGWVTSVIFYRNGVFLGTGTVSTGSTYLYSRSNIPVGTYSITAIATDNSGAITTSTPVTITVQSSNEGGNNGGNNTTCTAGSYRNGTTCTTCPANNYCPAGATTPTACPSGTTSPSGSRSVSHCINPNNPDSDGDGIPDSQEQITPNNGDANFDGSADATQTTVRTYQTPTNGVQVTIALTGLSTCTGTIITQLQTENQVANDASYTYPYGLNRIIVPCGQATVRVYYHGASTLPSMTYRKYLNNSYQNFPVTFGTQSGIPYLQFTLVDGGVGDSDGIINGTINDPGGIAVMQSAPPSGGGGGGGGRPSTVNCGNRRIDSGESCDDGNTRSGDGCSSTCNKELSTNPGGTSGSSTTPSTPKAAMIAMLQETVQTMQDACAYDTTDRSKKVQKLRDIKREDRFDPESVLVNYCITKGYKEKRQKTAHAGIGEVIKMITKIATIGEGIEFNERDKPKKGLPYTDIKQNAWYATYVNAAHERDLLDGLTDTHKNKKELKAFTPISTTQVTLLIENAGGSVSNNTKEDNQMADLISLVLPAKPNLSPVKKQSISRSEVAELLIASFPDVFANHQYLVGNNGQYLIKLLQTIAQKTESEQRSYINNKIQELKKVSASQYAEKYKIDVDVIIGFLQKAIAY